MKENKTFLAKPNLRELITAKRSSQEMLDVFFQVQMKRF